MLLPDEKRTIGLYKAREGRGEGSGDSESCESIFYCLDFRSAEASRISKGRRDINALIYHLGEDSDLMCCSGRVKRGPGAHRIIIFFLLGAAWVRSRAERPSVS